MADDRIRMDLLPVLGDVTDASGFGGHRTGVGKFMAPAVADYMRAKLQIADLPNQVLGLLNVGALPDVSPLTDATPLMGGDTEGSGKISLATLRAYVGGGINVRDKGAVGDGTTDAAPGIQAAITATPQAGGTIIVPAGTWLLNTDVLNPGDKPITWQISPGAHFVGVGKMPTLLSNTYHNATAYTLTTKPGVADCATGHGYSTISAEVFPDGTFVGNACAGYLGARMPAGGGFGWGLNTMMEMLPAFGGNGVSIEADINNYGSHPYRGQGVLVTGVGDSQTEVGVLVQRGDVASRWGVGLRVHHAEVGIDVDLSAIGALAQKGIWVRGIDDNLIVLQPSDDTAPGNAALFLNNASASQVNFKLTKRGGVVIGPGGAEVSKHMSATGPVNAGTISAQSSADFFVPLLGVVPGDSVTASPLGVVTAGVVWSAYAATDAVGIRLANVTSGGLDADGPGGLNWRVDCWKH